MDRQRGLNIQKEPEQKSRGGAHWREKHGVWLKLAMPATVLLLAIRFLEKKKRRPQRVLSRLLSVTNKIGGRVG